MEKQPYRQQRKISTILHVTPLPTYRLRIEFSSGSVLELNMENRLSTTRYYPLRDLDVFNSVTTDGEKLVFKVKSKYELDIFAQEAAEMALTPPLGMRLLRDMEG